MEDHKKQAAKPQSFIESVVTGLITGAAVIVAIKAGFRGLSAWAGKTKFDVKGVIDGPSMVAGALGGAIGILATRDTQEQNYISQLEQENAHLKGHMDEVKTQKSFAQEVRAQSDRKEEQSMVR